MPRPIWLVTTALVLAGLAPVSARQDRQFGGVGLGIYADINYRGLSATLIGDSPDLRSTGMAGKISSLRVGDGEAWQVCTERNYGGRCQVFSSDTSDLRRGGWNDVILSARRVRGGRGPVIGPGPGLPTTRGLELFAGTRYSGQRKVVMQAEPNLRRLDFNDRALSVRVPRGEVWEICVNADYDDCRIVDGDVPDLGPVGLNRQISSVRPRLNGRAEGGIGRGGTIPPRAQIVLYDDVNYRGRVTSILEATPTLRWLSNTAGSLKVVSGRWEVCDEPNFGGRCATVTNDIPDLARLRLRNRISSVRPR
jgi:Beta/Gamma crystallin